MTIVIYFHLSNYRTFKWYYKHYVEKVLKPYFPKLVSNIGEILSFCFTSGNVDDRNPEIMEYLTKRIYRKLFADRGYISQKFFEKLLENNITLVTKLKKNMKNKLYQMNDKLLLRKRAVIESVNDFLKNICSDRTYTPSFHREFLCQFNFRYDSYTFLPNKPSIILLRVIAFKNTLYRLFLLWFILKL